MTASRSLFFGRFYSAFLDSHPYGGTFHGELIEFAMAIIAMSLAEIGNISERRIFSLCDNKLSYGLPRILVGVSVELNGGYDFL